MCKSLERSIRLSFQTSGKRNATNHEKKWERKKKKENTKYKKMLGKRGKGIKENARKKQSQIVTAYAYLGPENWTKTQIQDGFNKSRKLQKHQSLKLHEDANVEINDYGNDLNDVNKFANYLNIEINIIDSEQFNEIIYSANKGCEDKIYLYKTRNHFDLIKSMTAFHNVAYYCHECKKTYTKRDKHKCPSKRLSCFTFIKGKKCEVMKFVKSVTENFTVKNVLRII